MSSLSVSIYTTSIVMVGYPNNSIVAADGYLFFTSGNNQNTGQPTSYKIVRVKLSNPITVEDWAPINYFNLVGGTGYNMGTTLSAYNGYLYAAAYTVHMNGVYTGNHTLNITRISTTIQGSYAANWFYSVIPAPGFTDMYSSFIDTRGYMYIIGYSYGNGNQIYIVNLINKQLLLTLPYTYRSYFSKFISYDSAANKTTMMVSHYVSSTYALYLCYINFNTNTIEYGAKLSETVANINGSALINNKLYYILSTSKTILREQNLTDLSITNYTIPNIPINHMTEYEDSIYTIPANTGTVEGNIYKLSFPVPPPSTPVILSAVSLSSSSLSISLSDSLNSSGVSYLYSTNNNIYGNSNVINNGSTTYNFIITNTGTPGVFLTDISYTLYVIAKSIYGCSAPTSTSVIVYQNPTAPPTRSFTLVNSGNVQVTIRETSSVPYYYLNNVSYHLYAYNNFGGNNLSGNTSLSIYNVPVGILSNTNTSYGNIVSYVNSGLTANTYTMYVIARNTVGNSNPVFANIVVLTTPVSPTIDASNTQSLTSGNLTVVIRDVSNSPTNGIYYLYSMDGGVSYGNSGVAKTANTTYTFTINNTGNAQIPLVANTYTLYIAASNPIGNTIANPATATEIVYTTPISPTIDIGNTQSFTSGNLTVVIRDASNSLINGIYYLYSMDGITYGNSGVAKTANTTYTFTINNTGNAQIPLVANTYTLRIAASNPIGNTIANPATTNIVLLTTPVSPTIDIGNTQSLSSGTLTVVIRDASNSPTNGIYYLYSMDGGISYGNSGVAKTTNTTYSFTINNTGNAQIPLVANTYTLYIASSNPIGNTIASPATATEIVYTTPVSPIIDISNTQSLSSGTLTVFINDTANSPTNGIYYLYSMDGITYGNSGVAKTGNTTYSFTINNTGNAQIPLIAKTYTLYIAAANPVGNSIASPATATEIVYTTPSPPTIDQGNTKSITSGNLNVGFTDTTNVANNQVEYTYFLYDSIAPSLFYV